MLLKKEHEVLQISRTREETENTLTWVTNRAIHKAGPTRLPDRSETVRLS